MLSTFPYKIIKKDPTLSHENSIKSTFSHLYNSNKISFDLLKYLKPFNSKCPHFYGCPKIHKKDFPLRPIVDFRFSPSYNLACFLNKILKPLTP